MEAIRCSADRCTNTGTPATMYRLPLDGDVDDEGLPVAVYCPGCEACRDKLLAEHAAWGPIGGLTFDTLAEWGDDDLIPEPDEDDLALFVDEQGETATIPRRTITFAEVAGEDYVEQYGRNPGTMVPYGDTMVELPDGWPEWDDVKAASEIVLPLAQAWFEAGYIEWADELAQDGSMYLVPAQAPVNEGQVA